MSLSSTWLGYLALQISMIFRSSRGNSFSPSVAATSCVCSTRTLFPPTSFPRLSQIHHRTRSSLRYARRASPYDLNGNEASKTDSTGTTNYTWDFENRLTSVALPGSGGTVQFSYDPFGRRIKKSSSAGTSIYAFDGDNLIEETSSSGAVVTRYAQQGLNLDEPLAMLQSSTTSYYSLDALGSVSSLSNGAGALAQTYTFDSFGNQTASSGSLTNPFRFAGRELDSETGLYYFRARYYDSKIGRFLSENPVGFQGGDNNVYRYSFNDPVNLEDPTGLTVTCTYNQFSGNLRCTDDSTGKVVVNTNGYSGGNEGKCPACVNNPEAQSVPFSGPIPTGYWSISKCFTWITGSGRQMSDVSPLTPLLGTSPDGFLRSPGFLIHGGRQNGARTASEGRDKAGESYDGSARRRLDRTTASLLFVIWRSRKSPSYF